MTPGAISHQRLRVNAHQLVSGRFICPAFLESVCIKKYTCKTAIVSPNCHSCIYLFATMAETTTTKSLQVRVHARSNQKTKRMLWRFLFNIGKLDRTLLEIGSRDSTSILPGETLAFNVMINCILPIAFLFWPSSAMSNVEKLEREPERRQKGIDCKR